MSWFDKVLHKIGLQRITPVPAYFQDQVVFPPAYSCSDVLMFAFILEGDKANINAYLGEMMSKLPTASVRYEAISHYVMLTFAHMPKVRPGAPFDQMGWMSETEVTAWILTMGKKKVGTVWVPDPTDVCFMAPYIWVDNPISIAGGREIYGLPKQWGQVTMPTTFDVQNPVPVSPLMLDAFAIKTFHPETQAVSQPLLEITCTGESTVDTAIWISVDDLLKGVYKALSSRYPRNSFVTPFVQAMPLPINLGLPLVFYKQFRSISNSRDACYQSISKMKVRIDWPTFQGGLLPGVYQLKVEDVASQPLKSHLGLSSQAPILQFWMQLNMTFGFGHNIFATASHS